VNEFRRIIHTYVQENSKMKFLLTNAKVLSSEVERWS